MGGYTHPESMVSTGWLDERRDDPLVAVIEVDEDTTAYEAGHIPGAISLHWQQELHSRPRRDFVSASRAADLLGRKGIATEQTIVLYGGNNNWFAAYAYWLCKMRGVDGVKLLDGGRIKWELEQRPLTTDVPEPPRRGCSGPAGAPGAARLPGRDDRAGSLRPGDAGRCPLTRRVQRQDHGTAASATGAALRAGHVPGAANIPWSKAANEDGTFRTADELRALYHDAGVVPDGGVITYCRIGERSSHTWFVLSELLGYPTVRNYDGSWTEYGSLVGVPVEAGASSA